MRVPTVASLADGPQLWIVPLDDSPSVPPVLSALETQRAETLRAAHLRRRFVVARTALRTLLGSVLDLEPGAVALATGPCGRPRLAAESGVSFNVSHCDETAVIGLTTHGEIGVDVESPAHVREPTRIAARFFEEGEAAVIARLPPQAAEMAFVRCWTAKEAVLKALGVGLTQPLCDVVVTCEPWAPMRLRRVPGTRSVRSWSLHELGLLRGRLNVAIAVAAGGVPVVGVHRYHAVEHP